MSTLAGGIGAAVVCVAASGPQPSPPECDEAVLTVRAFMTALGNADLDRLVATFDNMEIMIDYLQNLEPGVLDCQ